MWYSFLRLCGSPAPGILATHRREVVTIVVMTGARVRPKKVFVKCRIWLNG